MRALTLVLLGLFAVACGTTSTKTPDSGTIDAGVDAGKMPVCLSDFEDAGSSDAGWDGGYDFSCLGAAPTRGGQAQLVISGIVNKAGLSRTALPDVNVDLVSGDGTLLASTHSDDGGHYTLSYDAGCEPVSGEVRATHPPADAGYYVSYAVPIGTWTRDRASLELLMFDTSTSGLVAGIAGVTIGDGGVLAVHVSDCAGNPVSGAVLSTLGDVGAIRYVGVSGLPSAMLKATTSAGDVLIFNLPGASVNVSATLDGGVFSRRVVPIHTNAVSGTTLAP